MKKILIAFTSLLFLIGANAYAVDTPAFASIWDKPSDSVNNMLTGLESEAGTSLTLSKASAASEPGILVMFGLGLIGLIATRKRIKVQE